MHQRLISGQTWLATLLLALVMVFNHAALAQVPYLHFESGHVKPIAMSPDGSRLVSVNTSDNHIEIFSLRSDGFVHEYSLPVGMEPVSVTFRDNTQVWVVNHLSDSISIVDLTGTPRVTKTLLVGDEPRDLVFANDRAFITTAHKGQHRTHSSVAAVPGAGDPELTTPGVARADVWVFDAANTGAGLGGTPLRIIELFGDTPRALAVSPDGTTVYAAVFMSGNQTAVVNEGVVCNGFGPNSCAGDGVISPNGLPGGAMPGGLPGPSANVHGDNAPETSLIVKYDNASGEWRDQLDRNWSNGIRFTLPDYDVFSIDATTLNETERFSGVGTTLFNMVVNPVNGDVYVSNTEAINEVRFEGSGSGGSTVQGNLAQSRLSILTSTGNVVRNLNSHIDYSVTPAPVGTKDHSLATPTDMAISADGSTLYLAAFGSNRIGVFATADVLDGSFNPETASSDYIDIPGGPSGVVLDESRNRLYVSTRYDNALVAIDLDNGNILARRALHNPEPATVIDGRPFLYDANLTSSNGEAACASCHIFGDMDGLAWDLGNPDEAVIDSPLTVNLQNIVTFLNQASDEINGTGNLNQLHPMKGPMTTQTLRGMSNSGAMHWRGDRAVGEFGTDATDEVISFLNFNVAFPGLLGNSDELTPAEMASFTNFALALTLPPNPVRALDNSLNANERAGQDFYLGPRRSDGVPFDFTGQQDGFTCNGCHELNPALGRFGASTAASFEDEEQIFKIPHLRNMYQKVGMFGMPQASFFLANDTSHQGDQVRGTGFLHDGSTDTLFRFFRASVFNSALNDTVGFPNNQARRDTVDYMMAFDTDLAPVVGQQITLTNQSGTDVTSRIDLLLNSAGTSFVSKILGGNTTEADVVVHGVINNQAVSYARLGDGTFQSSASAEPPISALALRNLVDGDSDRLTYTAFPPGYAQRTANDRDLDGVFDVEDNCPLSANVSQADGDGDGIGDACDNCIAGENDSQLDTNGDGFGNACDADFDNDGIVNFLDFVLLQQDVFQSGVFDTDLNADGAVNFLDVAMFSNQFLGSPGPSAFN
ncbi:MAG: thrombospondin type 3 repeat-containing protein [Gammaproteobacteria bacterium]